ncbi:MAG: FkbM family methyltransferase, partial [Nitrospinales bacterium]
KYNPQIYIFEVVPEHFISIRERFKNNPKVSVFNFGLSDKNKELGVRVENEKSSIHKSGGRQVSVSLVDVEEFFNREGIDHVDLMKINIEGGEYDLLKGMIRSDLIRACNDLQIQFHDFFENAKSMRREIRKELEHTHYLTFDYSFVWENWRRRE